MKKKVLMLIVIISIFVIIFNYCIAAEAKSIELNVQDQITVEEGTETLEVIVGLGEFTGIEDNVVLGLEAQLEYNENMFTSIEAEGTNGWIVTYEPATKVLVGEVTSAIAKSNTNIAKITLKLKSGLTAGTEGEIKLNNVILSGGGEDEKFEFNKIVKVAVKEKQTTVQPTPPSTPQTQQPSTTPESPTPTPSTTTQTPSTPSTPAVQNNTKDNTNKQNTNKQNTNNNRANTNIPSTTNNTNVKDIVATNTKTITSATTTEIKNIPKAGRSNVLNIIFIVALISVSFSFIRYKSIKLK